MDSTALSDEDLQRLYSWVDEVPLSRPKRNIARDFSDGVLVAEVIAHFIPRLVEVHNYSAANSTPQKVYNWNTLNARVMKKLGLQFSREEINEIITCEPGAIEQALHRVQLKVTAYLARAQQRAQAGAGPSRGAGGARSVGGGGGARGFRGAALSPPPPPPPGPGGAGGGGGGAAAAAGVYAGGGRRPAGGFEQIPQNLQNEVDQELLLEREQTIQELRETVGILELKIVKLEQLVRLKDAKIQKLQDQVKATQNGP